MCRQMHSVIVPLEQGTSGVQSVAEALVDTSSSPGWGADVTQKTHISDLTSAALLTFPACNPVSSHASHRSELAGLHW